MQDYYDLVQRYPFLFDNKDVPFQVITNWREIEAWEQERRKVLSQKAYPLSWAKLGIVLDDPYILGIRDLVEFPDGTRRGYIRIIERASLERGQSVAILPLNRTNEKFLLLRHFRHATRSWHIEIPRGFGEADTSPRTQAEREVWEELQVRVNSMVPLGTFHANTGLENTETYLFLAKVNEPGTPNIDEGIREVISLTRVEIEDYIKSGKITDSFTIGAYVRAKLQGYI